MLTKYIEVSFIICYDEGNAMHPDWFDTEQLLEIKKFNPGTLTQILMYYEIYMFYEEENFPLDDVSEISYSVHNNQLILDNKYFINNNTKVYVLTYNDDDSEFQFNVSEIIETYSNLPEDDREHFFSDDFEEKIPISALADHKVFYSENGINKFYNELLSQFRNLVSKNAPVNCLDAEIISKNDAEELLNQLKSATLYLESVVDALNQTNPKR